ncbi:LysR substrate-binding domain-containing protein [Paraburkholderia graminis]|uniref:LysR substrate-binding domain-containing protein n=1 Tax=Paraburkholderia graminis TaxID=60548 RepID=UPI0038B9A9B9
MRKLPPLNAVRAFEAVLRHGSLTRAAEELHVTHGALSRQVASLEEWVGRPLFVRTPSSALVSTEAGRRYGQALTVLLDRLATVSEATRQNAVNAIAVTAAPTFTMNWLIPRISAFYGKYPDVVVKLSTSVQPAQLRDGESDIVIHSVSVPQERVDCMAFMDDYYLPICHVDLLQGAGEADGEWLSGQTLLAYASWPDSWEIWARNAGVAIRENARMQRFEHMFLARQAVLEGLGVGILPLAVVLDDIVQGRLMAPFQLDNARHRSWQACHLQYASENPLIASFLEWLRLEGRNFERAACCCVDSLGWRQNPFRHF